VTEAGVTLKNPKQGAGSIGFGAGKQSITDLQAGFQWGRMLGSKLMV
jgi:hypothetical protein